jgi:ribonuclease T2
MRRVILVAFAATALVSLALNLDARSRRRNSGAGGNRAGEFDYYLMSLSWSPQYCSGPGGERDSGQCGEGRRFGFAVHGLWPQFEQGYPEACGEAAPVPSPIVNAMLALMPSPRLIEHEWETHGTCSGLDVNAYCDEIRKAFATVRVPEDFKQPQREAMVAPGEVKSRFARAPNRSITRRKGEAAPRRSHGGR